MTEPATYQDAVHVTKAKPTWPGSSVPISLNLPYNEHFQGAFVELREAFTYRLGRAYREPNHQPDTAGLTEVADLLAALAIAPNTGSAFKHLDARSDNPARTPTRHVLIPVALSPIHLGSRGTFSDRKSVV